MSSEITQSPEVTSVSYSFVLKWTLKAKQLNDLKCNSDNSLVLSDIFKFKLGHACHFYLQVQALENWGDPYLSISIKGSKMWSFKLAYAFLVCKERAFRLSESPHLSFLYQYYKSVSNEEDVTIYCEVCARPIHPASSAKESEISVKEDKFLVEEDELQIKEEQNTVEFENVSDIPLLINYKNEAVIDFILHGDVPALTIDKVIEIISETKEHKCEALKILCLQYLMKNITKQSIRKISKAALDYDLLPLQRCCLEPIAYDNLK